MAFAAAAVASVAWALARGTSPGALLEGLVLGPARQLEAIALFLPVTAPAAAGALAGLGVALAWLAARRSGRTTGRTATAIEGAAQLAAGAVVWLAADERLAGGPLAPLPLLWLALLPPPDAPAPGVTTGPAPAGGAGRPAGPPRLPGGREPGRVGHVPVRPDRSDPHRRRLAAERRGAGARRGAGWARPVGAVLALAAVALVAATVRTTGQRLEAAYAAGVPLGLPGTEGIRVRPGQARLYRVLATTLAARCRTFVTMPGLNSLHLFSGVDPPSARNTTLWVALLSAAQQTEVADRLARVDAPVCAVSKPDAAFDGRDTPLIRYIRREFVTEFTVGDYAFMMRRARQG